MDSTTLICLEAPEKWWTPPLFGHPRVVDSTTFIHREAAEKWLTSPLSSAGMPLRSGGLHHFYLPGSPREVVDSTTFRTSASGGLHHFSDFREWWPPTRSTAGKPPRRGAFHHFYLSRCSQEVVDSTIFICREAPEKLWTPSLVSAGRVREKW